MKDRLSHDTWRVLQQLERDATGPAPAHPDRLFVAATTRLDDIVIGMAAFAGLLAENPSRGQGWRFLEIGRRIERGLQMIDLLRVGVASAPFPDDAYLEVLLHVADSATSYRSRYLTATRTRFILEFLLCDEQNPRSVAFQFSKLLALVDVLPQHNAAATATAEHTAAARLLASTREASIDTLKRRDAAGERPALEAYLQTLRSGVTDVADALTARYLVHTAASRLTASS